MKNWIIVNRIAIICAILIIVASALVYSYSILEPVLAAKRADIKKKRDIAETYTQLHAFESGSRIKSRYPDVELVYTDDGHGVPFPETIVPFEYYYSATADKTLGICAINKSIFICEGKIDHVITQKEMLSSKCRVAQAYLVREGLMIDSREDKFPQ